MASAKQSMFSLHKALASLAYLVKHTDETLYPVMKMIYVAEKRHLERYGRLITGDTYVAMEKGPVPSRMYDLMKFLRGDRSHFDGGEEARAVLTCDARTHKLGLLGKPDLSELSESDIECLDAIVTQWRAHGAGEIRRMSHDDAWRATSRNSNMSLSTIAAQLENGALITQHLADRYPGTAH